MKIYEDLIVGDPHIQEDATEEIDRLFTEVLSYKAKRLIMLGDYYTKNRPTAKEILFGTKWAAIFADTYDEVIFLTGNHTQVADKVSCIDYLQYLGVHIEDEFTDVINNRFYGHFMLDGSDLAFNTHERKTLDFEGFNRVILGHQHKFQHITPKITHLGSIRRVDFGEVSYEPPQLLAFNAGEEIYLPLSTYTPMEICRSIAQMRDSFRETKLLYVFSSYSQFINEIGEVNKLKDEFIQVKVKLDFTKSNIEYVKNENKNFNDLLKEFLLTLEEHSRKEIEEIISYEI